MDIGLYLDCEIHFYGSEKMSNGHKVRKVTYEKMNFLVIVSARIANALDMKGIF